jgi:hypothetical protein
LERVYQVRETIDAIAANVKIIRTQLFVWIYSLSYPSPGSARFVLPKLQREVKIKLCRA